MEEEQKKAQDLKTEDIQCTEPETETPVEPPQAEEAAKQQAEAPEPEKQEPKSDEKKEKGFLGKKKQNAEIGKLQQQIEAAKAEAEEWKEKYARLAAEYDNYRKRTTKELDARYTDAKADTWKDILGIIDDFERALQAEISPECQNYKDGVNLIYKKLTDIMASAGIEEIRSLHEPFDPELHTAVMHIDSEEAGENEVVEVLMKGYRLGDKVIRHSMVKVAN